MRAIELGLVCTTLLAPGVTAAGVYDEFIESFQRPSREPIVVAPADPARLRPGQQARQRIDAYLRIESEGGRDEAGSGSTRTRSPPEDRLRTRERLPWLGPPTIPVGDRVSEPGCRYGDARPAEGATPRTVIWVLPGRRAYVDVVSASEHGRYAVPDGRKVFELMRWASYVTAPGIPLPPPVKLPLKIAATAGRIGEAAYDAGTRWAEQNARTLVDVTVRMPRSRVTLTCLHVEVCTRGRWCEGGVRVMDEQVTEMPPLQLTAHDVFGAALEVTARTLLQSLQIRQLRAAEQAYQDHPCEGGSEEQAASTPGASVGDATPTTFTSVAPAPAPSRRDCQPIRDALDAARRELDERVGERDAKRQRLAQLEREREMRTSQAEGRLVAAERALRVAQEAEKNLVDNSRNISGHAAASYRAALRRAGARTDRASQSVDQARAARESARAPTRDEFDLENQIRDLDTQVSALEARVRELAEQLRTCESGQ